MKNNRLDQLKEMLKESPDDPFLLYAIALEHRGNDTRIASELLREVIEKHPEYLPAYYQAAQIKEELSQLEEAITLYRTGMELAKNQNNLAALKELKAAYELLLED